MPLLANHFSARSARCLGGTVAATCCPDVDVSTGDCLFGGLDLDYEQILTLSSGADWAGVGRMLAYIFWHAPKPTAARADYERDLVAFSRALSDLNDTAAIW